MKTSVKSRKTTAVLIAVAVVLVAATWYGTYDVPFNPRDPASLQDAHNFIRTKVNLDVSTWRPADTVTLCQSGSTRCALYWYVPVSVVWAKARDIDTRSRPPEAWLERVIKWLTGQGSDPGSLYETVTYEGDGSFGDCYGYGPGVRITYYVDGFWRHGYVNGQYAGSVFIGTTLYQYETMGGSVCA